ncbi:MAG: hypothetical protein OXC40_03725 [Proteobacteria bacterium]|nr:hypothetical protein [Pseudomonadota bacterium]
MHTQQTQEFSLLTHCLTIIRWTVPLFTTLIIATSTIMVGCGDSQEAPQPQEEEFNPVEPIEPVPEPSDEVTEPPIEETVPNDDGSGTIFFPGQTPTQGKGGYLPMQGAVQNGGVPSSEIVQEQVTWQNGKQPTQQPGQSKGGQYNPSNTQGHTGTVTKDPTANPGPISQEQDTQIDQNIGVNSHNGVFSAAFLDRFVNMPPVDNCTDYPFSSLKSLCVGFSLQLTPKRGKIFPPLTLKRNRDTLAPIGYHAIISLDSSRERVVIQIKHPLVRTVEAKRFGYEFSSTSQPGRIKRAISSVPSSIFLPSRLSGQRSHLSIDIISKSGNTCQIVAHFLSESSRVIKAKYAGSAKCK